MRKPNYSTDEQMQFCENIGKHFDTDVVNTAQINEFVKDNDLPIPHFLINDKSRSAGWGKYRVRTTGSSVAAEATTVGHAVRALSEDDLGHNVMDIITTRPVIPAKDPTYVPFGFYKDLENIISSKMFFPVYITGLSGNGKTLMVDQICANIQRELYRVNITKDTDELDLIGSYELINGSTIYREGPAITAMKRGAILLLDETDYGSERLLCLQPILEGKPYFNKKTKELVYPALGFNVVATANTKGKGSNDGRFIGANTLNDAFLERFAITVEQEYPAPRTETLILEKNFFELGIDKVESDPFVAHLVSWAEMVRKTYNDGAIDEIVSTRRLCHITKAYSVFKNRKKAITLCLNRFEAETKTSLIDLYDKLDVDSNKSSGASAQPAGNGVTPAEPSAIEFIPTASKLKKKYGTEVVINFASKSKDVVVKSHGKSTNIGTVANPGSNEFMETVRKTIETHMVSTVNKVI